MASSGLALTPTSVVAFNRCSRGLGVNIHFSDARPGQLDMLAAAGFYLVRIDFLWSEKEKRPVVYDFSAYDRLLAELEVLKLRAMLHSRLRQPALKEAS